MATQTINGIKINKITKALYDTYVSNGTITTEMLANQVWIFTDDAFYSEVEKTKLEGISANAQVNVIEGISVNGVNTTIDTGKVVNIVIPTKTSDITNDNGFIDNTVTNLVNYFTKTEVNQLIAGVTTFSAEIVSSLPTTNISTTKIYLVLKTSGAAGNVTGNVYNEYLYINGSWELIGDTALDLTGCVNTIDTIKVNGVVQTPDETKAVNITIPECEAKTIVWS